jgi:hypothetical protein
MLRPAGPSKAPLPLNSPTVAVRLLYHGAPVKYGLNGTRGQGAFAIKHASPSTDTPHKHAHAPPQVLEVLQMRSTSIVYSPHRSLGVSH